MQILKKLSDLLTYNERRRAILLMAMIVVMALFDALGVASILPFITLLTSPQVVETSQFLNVVFQALRGLGLQTTQQFLFLMGILVFILLVLSLGFKALTNYFQIRFGLMCEYSIAKRLVEGYLHQPYSWFLNRHSADLGKTILSEVSIVIYGGIVPLITFFAQCAVTVALISCLMIVDLKLALSVILVLGAVYGAIFFIMSGSLKRLGQTCKDSNHERFLVVSEAFSAAKELKLAGLENVYIDRFAAPAETYARGQAAAQMIAQTPRFVLEAVAFGGMMLVLLYLLNDKSGLTAAIPTIALYAYAGYRLMPAAQQIYGAFTQLRFVGPALESLHTELVGLNVRNVSRPETEPIRCNKAIELRKIDYQYPNASGPTLTDINLTIPARSRIGFVGTTGSGKSTTVDVILGLLEPQRGALIVDGQEINSTNLREWQRSIGYVPQQIYLADDTVLLNIAFGLSLSEIDLESVERAARIANLHDFVINDLPNGYDTLVGERGVRLSGGQRQRIGIARALYHNPQILVLDEATSALDNLTEQAVIEALNNLGHEITIILIAHRLSTVRQCDQVYMFERGRIKAQGTYPALKRDNERFASLTVMPN